MTNAQTALQKPTRARYWVVAFALSLAILSYIDRVALSKAAPRVQAALNIDEAHWGLVVGAFGLGYALFEIPGGFLGDWLGPKRVLIRIVLWWSFFTAAMGWMWNWVSLTVAQFLFASGEAGCFPNLTKAFASWLRRDERVKIQGVMWAAARWGGAFTPYIVFATWDMLEHVFRVPASSSWRWGFVCFGMLGLVWCGLFWWWFRDRPQDHPSVNAAELEQLKDVQGMAGGHADVPWGKLVRSRSVVLLWVQYFCCSFPWYFYITYLSKYLREYHKVTDEQVSAVYAIVPLLFGGIGCLVAGFMAARLARAMGSVSRSRKLLSCAGFAGGAIFMAIAAHMHDPLWAMLALGMSSFSNDLNMPGAWGSCMDIGGKYAGTVAGSMNMMGNLAGFAAPVVCGFILQNYNHSYTLFMYVMAVAYVIGFCAWPFIDPTTPLEAEAPAA